MKRQFYLDDVERSLIRNALDLWTYRLEKANENCGNGHFYAARFTREQINALKARLQEPTANGG